MKHIQTVKLEHGTEIEISLSENMVYEIEGLVLFGVEIEKPWVIPTRMYEAILEAAIEHSEDFSWREYDA